MMRKLLAFPLFAALVAATPPQPKVEVATGDWSQLPLLKFQGYDNLSSAVMTKLYEIRRQKRCQLPGLSSTQIELSVSFAAQFSPDGQLKRLLLPQLDCPEAEAWIGGTLVKSLQHGDFRPTGRNPEGWYRGDLSFSYEG